jgi:poly [ADP-ribose] polymerase
MTDEYAVAGKKVAKLVCVAVGGATKQSNKFYNMYEQNDGTFLARWGRIEGRIDSKSYPMSKWDSTIKDKTKRKVDPYTDVTHLFAESAEPSNDNQDANRVDSIKDVKVQQVIAKLQSYATNSVQQNYTISSKAVTQQMVDEAQAIVDNISNQIAQFNTSSSDSLTKLKALNALLLKLYHVIPRRMKDVRNHLVAEDTSTNTNVAEFFAKIIEDEQATLDVMAGQVLMNEKDAEAVVDQQPKQQSILDLLGLTMRAANDDEIANIKRLLGPNASQFKNAYAVSNVATQTKYNKALNVVSNKKEELFWHGSRNQNWLNILSTGLMIRPSGAIHTGSMFGDGIYYADRAQKSIGYTSLRGSYWSNGTENVAYLALFSVHVGEQLHIHKHDHSCYKLCKSVLQKQNKDSVFAHGGADLRNNEYIVYDSNQSTVSFLVEISN